MSRQSKQRPARRHVPEQIDLFAGAALTRGDRVPAWSGLPTETRTALTNLMTRLILDYADQRQIGSTTEDGHDL